MLKFSAALLSGAVALSLAACDSGKSENTRHGKEAKGPAARSESLRAGLYKVTEVGDVDVEDERCFTAEDIATGRFAAPGSSEEGWTIEANRMSDGTIEVTAHHPTGSRLNIDGTFERESFAVDGTLEVKLNGETHIVRTKQRGRFASPDCPIDAEISS
ncbi:MAG TPA: hypothetical protein VEZ59_12840 [Sphingopyxis sp.]|nr:hypothetical protein [Sphingopyxis sp.]